jgi:hypothetical protein
MAKASFRWVCTYCDASDLAESPEMAELAVDVHVSLFHAAPREEIRTQGEPDGSVLTQQKGGSAATGVTGLPASHTPDQLPLSDSAPRGNWWHALFNLIWHGRRR